jgi:hypothetical protein
MNGNKQLAQEMAVGGSSGWASKNHLTKADLFRQIVWEVAGFVGLVGVLYLYCAITEKRDRSQKIGNR